MPIDAKIWVCRLLALVRGLDLCHVFQVSVLGRIAIVFAVILFAEGATAAVAAGEPPECRIKEDGSDCVVEKWDEGRNMAYVQLGRSSQSPVNVVLSRRGKVSSVTPVDFAAAPDTKDCSASTTCPGGVKIACSIDGGQETVCYESPGENIGCFRVESDGYVTGAIAECE